MKNQAMLLLTAALLFAGCDSGSSPVAPSATSLIVTANPEKITVTGASTIEVLATEGGLPVRAGTEIRLTTTLGSIFDEVVATDDDGVARTVLEADGRPGTATVTVRSGAATAVTQDVTIGDSTLTAKFSFSVSERTVIFTDTSTVSAGSASVIDSWSWDFGDHTGSTAKDPVHTYAEDSTYVVTLTVVSAGGEDSVSQFVTVPADAGEGG